MKDDMYPLFCFSVSSRVTPKKSQFLKCRLLGKKKNEAFFTWKLLVLCWELLFLGSVVWSCFFFLVRTPVSFLQMFC